MMLMDEVQNLGRRMARAELEKNASLADAILGAPLGAVAARIAAPEESKEKATAYGLVLGALMGFVRGQQSVAAFLKQEAEGRKNKKPALSPMAASLLTGAAIGGAAHLPNLVGRLVPNKK